MITKRTITAARAGLLVLAGGLLLQAGPADAVRTEDPPTAGLGGFQGLAQASGLHLLYNPEGLLPTSPPLDAGAPDALATINTGPSTFARSSVLDPGDLLANPDALLSLGVSGYKSGTIPAYPYRAVASSDAGKQADESAPAPGLDAKAGANATTATAVATMPRSVAPAIATVGTMSSTATSTTDGSTVTVHAISQISGFNLLGVLKIDSVVTDLTATSDGVKTTTSGGTTIAGATVGTIPVTIDANGVHRAPADPKDPLGNVLGGVTKPILNNLDDALAKAGIHVTLAGPAAEGGGTSGQLGSDGLRIDIAATTASVPALRNLIDALPPLPALIPGAPTPEDLIQAFKARHVFAIQLGRGVVTLSARPKRPPVDVVVTPPSTPTFDSPSSTPSLADVGSPAQFGSPIGSTPVSAPSLASAAPVPTRRASSPVDVSTGAGVGALVLLALLTQPIIGDRLARGAGALLAGAGETCPWEER